MGKHNMTTIFFQDGQTRFVRYIQLRFHQLTITHFPHPPCLWLVGILAVRNHVRDDDAVARLGLLPGQMYCVGIWQAPTNILGD